MSELFGSMVVVPCVRCRGVQQLLAGVMTIGFPPGMYPPSGAGGFFRLLSSCKLSGGPSWIFGCVEESRCACACTYWCSAAALVRQASARQL